MRTRTRTEKMAKIDENKEMRKRSKRNIWKIEGHKEKQREYERKTKK